MGTLAVVEVLVVVLVGSEKLGGMTNTLLWSWL